MKNKGLITIVVLLLISLAFNIKLGVTFPKEVNDLKAIVSSDLNGLNNRLEVLEADDPQEQEVLPTPKYGELITVKKVVDGDTIELEDGERLRYIGIDTPEKNDPRKPVQCFADQATQKNKELVEGKKSNLIRMLPRGTSIKDYWAMCIWKMGHL